MSAWRNSVWSSGLRYRSQKCEQVSLGARFLQTFVCTPSAVQAESLQVRLSGRNGNNMSARITAASQKGLHMHKKSQHELNSRHSRWFGVRFLRLRNHRGVTLIELMSSVVIMGIIAAMAGPRFAHEMEKMEFRGSARSMVSTLRQARSLAISEKTEYGVAFDAAAGTFTLFKDNVSSTPAAFQTGDSIISVDTIPGQYATLSATFSSAVLFQSNGSASESGTVIPISYGSDAGSATRYATISVLSSTGRVRLNEIHTY